MNKCRSLLKRAAALLAVLFLLCGLLWVPAQADNQDYGEDAWTYLQYIDGNQGYRITNKEMTEDTAGKDNAGAWISSELSGMGYEVQKLEWEHNENPIVDYYVTKPGKSKQKLVIGAHYDCVDTKGVEDNGTGISVLLELARRFYDTETPLTLEFCFFDGEETQGYSGSYYYLDNVDRSEIFCYFNLDCLGAGDIMYVYGGDYEDGKLVRDWGYNMARYAAYRLGYTLHPLPEAVEEPKTPTRPSSSDHYYFNVYGIPYVYFEANCWVKADGSIGNPELKHFYNSDLPEFASTNGQIIHTEAFEDLATLERLVPGRIKAHMTAYSEIVSLMIREMNANSPGLYEYPIDMPETTAEDEGSSEEDGSASASESADSEGTEQEPAGTGSGEESEGSEGTGSAPETEPGQDPENQEGSSSAEGEKGSGDPSSEEASASEQKESSHRKPMSAERKRAMWLYIAGTGAASIVLIALSAYFLKNR